MNPPMRKIVVALASLKLTATLLFLGMVLVLAGTLAQVEAGIWTVLQSYFRCFVTWIGPLPFPGGYTIGGLMLVNLVAAHIVRFKAQGSRAGIFILHAGLILLLIGELVTALWAVEGNMTIEEGSWSSFIEDDHRIELAIIDPSDPESDRVIVVPEEFISRPGATVADTRLPFEIEVVDWMNNSELLRHGGHASSPATEGDGLTIIARALPPASGVGDRTIDVPSCYLRLSRDGVDIGTWLVSLYLGRPQQVPVGDETWNIALRRQRTYKPYTLHLIDFRHDKFTGTEMARNFSSLVRLVDPTNNQDREILIYMNHPLRYRGEAFYQASFLRGDSGTVLQVVRNPGWLLPYVSCTLVAIGLLIHFGIVLRRFTKRARKKAEDEPVVEQGRWQKLLPWALLLLLVLSLAGKAIPTGGDEALDLDRFGRIPVSSDGRVKPLDTVARNSLMILSDRQTYQVGGVRRPAIQWLLELYAMPQEAGRGEIFRIDQPEVLALIGKRQEDGKRFSFDTIMAHINEITRQAQMASEVPTPERNSFQRHVLDLYDQLSLYAGLARFSKPYIVPPLTPEQDWRPLMEGLQGGDAGEVDTPAIGFRNLISAYHHGDAAVFNRELSDYLALMREHVPSAVNKAGFEVFFNRFEPFYMATIFYILAFLVGCVSFLMRCTAKTAWATSLIRATNWLLLGTFILHTLGLAARIYLQGRPPVTNLYSSSIFVGWGCVLLAFFLERYFRTGLAAGLASLIGFVTLIIAHNLSTDGDTMQMMQAVLDSNFWLSTHVITITIGYSGTFLAGILGTVYLILGVFTRLLDRDNARSLSRMIFGVVCFAVLFSFVGTVLGGIWADQSWGRFWGWDPKENGALLIVMWTAVILHARLVGMVRERGLAALAVGGNIVTAWSWFGTNMLGVGLHSYGFMNSAVFWMAIFIASQLLVMSLALIPQSRWRSFTGTTDAPIEGPGERS